MNITSDKSDEFQLNVKEEPLTSRIGTSVLPETMVAEMQISYSEPSKRILDASRSRESNSYFSRSEKYMSIIAHDLKNPFNAILGFLEILKENLHELDRKTVESYVDHIYNSANRAYHLLETLLEWSLLQNQAKFYNPARVQLHELINEEIENVNYLALPKQITIKHTIPSGLVVYGDKQMIKTILRNLLDNAVKFTHQEGEVVVSSERAKGFVEISVKDNGIGISPEMRDRLLQGCIHQTTPGTNNEKGTGLGLLLCKEFTEMQGGAFDIESTLCQGSTFKFSIPY